MKLCQMIIFGLLVSIITTPHVYAAETSLKWKIERDGNGLKIYGKEDDPGDISLLVESMLANPYQLLNFDKKLHGISGLYERTDGVLARKKKKNHCRRHKALAAIKKHTFRKLKSLRNPTLVFYDARRFFSELELLIHLQHKGIHFKRVILIDATFGDIFDLAEKANFNFNDMLTLSDSYDPIPPLRRIHALLNVLSRMSKRTVELYIYPHADLLASDMDGRNWGYHMVVAMDHKRDLAEHYNLEERVITDADLYGVLMKHLRKGGFLVDFNIESLSIFSKNFEPLATPKYYALINTPPLDRTAFTYSDCTAESKIAYVNLYICFWGLEALEKSLLEIDFNETMKQLIYLKKSPELLKRAIELRNGRGGFIITNAIAFEEGSWPLYLMLKASEKNENFEEIINHKQIICNKPCSPLEYALKYDKFSAAETLLTFGVSPNVQEIVFNHLKAMRKYAYLALLWLYGAKEPVEFAPQINQIHEIIKNCPELKMAFALELKSKQWNGQLETLKKIGNEFLATR